LTIIEMPASHKADIKNNTSISGVTFAPCIKAWSKLLARPSLDDVNLVRKGAYLMPSAHIVLNAKQMAHTDKANLSPGPPFPPSEVSWAKLLMEAQLVIAKTNQMSLLGDKAWSGGIRKGREGSYPGLFDPRDLLEP
jgi:hypothetical protein